jgi:GABA permease
MVILESTRESLMLSLALAAVVVGIGVWRYRKGGPAGPSPEAPQGEDAAVGARQAS